MNSHLTATDHVDGLMSRCFGLLYLMCILHNHGIPETSLKDVFHAIVLSRLFYWSGFCTGFCTAADRERLEAFLRRCKRYGYCDPNTPRIIELLNDATGVNKWTELGMKIFVCDYLETTTVDITDISYVSHLMSCHEVAMMLTPSQ